MYLSFSWTEQENNRLKQLVSEGSTYAQVAEQLPGRSRKAVSIRAVEIGSPAPRRPHGRLVPALLWTTEERQQLATYLAKGLSQREAAEQLSRTYQAVRTELSRQSKKARGLYGGLV